MSDFNFQTQASNLAMAGTANGVPYTDAEKAEMARCIVEKQHGFAWSALPRPHPRLRSPRRRLAPRQCKSRRREHGTLCRLRPNAAPRPSHA
jgi:hypothetical protein|eukprot:COSAG01_NODE_8325_length_2829_cov_6.738095_2_plen_92_part_00